MGLNGQRGINAERQSAGQDRAPNLLIDNPPVKQSAKYR
jgi:hypothetical protein